MKTKIFIAVITLAAFNVASADDFNYLSGGILYHQAGFAKKNNQYAVAYGKPYNDPMDYKKTNKAALGFYLNGSWSINNSLFAELRLDHSHLIQQSLLGFGVHFPVSPSIAFYGLVGATQKTILLKPHYTVTVNPNNPYLLIGKKFKEVNTSYKDSVRPTVEVGTKWRINGLSGLRLSYRYAQFGNENKLGLALMDQQLKADKHLHDIHLGSYYQLMEHLSFEAAYNQTRFLKISQTSQDPGFEPFKAYRGVTVDHKVTVGIRYSL